MIDTSSVCKNSLYIDINTRGQLCCKCRPDCHFLGGGGDDDDDTFSTKILIFGCLNLLIFSFKICYFYV